MHLDLNHADAVGDLTGEVCVIGSGVAGLTVTRRLLESGRSVILLESGGLDYEKATAELNAGHNVGQAYYDLEDARLRFFGGTAAIWGGRLAELDPIDLESRPWVPHSGWPISWDELQRYYEPARRIFGEPAEAASAADLGLAGGAPPAFDPEKLEVGVWSFDRRFNRFAFASSRDLVEHERCVVVTHATVTDLGLHHGGGHVETVRAQSLQGRRLTVRTRAVVLAAGGIENARLLLASNTEAPRGLGNTYDQVGRYFMEHPHARGGRLRSGDAWRLLRAFGRTHRYASRELAGLIKPSPAFQAENGVLNSSLTIAARQPAHARQALGMRAYGHLKHSTPPTRVGRAAWMAAKRTSTWLQQRTDPLRPWVLQKLGLREIALIVRAEQSPNPHSRLLLTDQKDALGVPRLALDWRTARLDVESVSRLVDALDAELARLSLGRIEKADWLASPTEHWETDPLISAHPIGGYHHMGTTRMSESPRNGVTDATGQVHGVGNLFIVGSSTFPTSGWANPTLTIAALALRTADKISLALRPSRAA